MTLVTYTSAGDVVCIKISRLGVFENSIVDEP